MGCRAAGSRHGRAATALPADRRERRCGGGLKPPARLDGAIDSHCHLQNEAFDADREAVIERARAAGVVRLLVPGYDAASSRAAVELASQQPDFIDAAVGIHPHHVGTATQRDWDEIESLARAASVAAIGETGLDYHRNLSPPEAQREGLQRQLRLAAERELPVIVHDREAHDDVANVLLAWSGPRNRSWRGILHCFSGDRELALRLHAAGMLISFALPVAFSSARGPRDAAAWLPAGGLLVETDSPWLAPGSGARNEPTTVLRVIAEIARLRGVEPATLVTEVGASYRALLAR